MRREIQVTVLALAAMLQVSAQDKKLLAEEFPLVDKKCSITSRDWNGKQDWVASCKLFVFKKVGETQTEGVTLFDLPLVMGHPSTFEEASKAVGRWLAKSSNEILFRNGYTVSSSKRKKK